MSSPNLSVRQLTYVGIRAELLTSARLLEPSVRRKPIFSPDLVLGILGTRACGYGSIHYGLKNGDFAFSRSRATDLLINDAAILRSDLDWVLPSTSSTIVNQLSVTCDIGQAGVANRGSALISGIKLNIEGAQIGVQTRILDWHDIGVGAGLIAVFMPIAGWRNEGAAGAPVGTLRIPDRAVSIEFLAYQRIDAGIGFDYKVQSDRLMPMR